MEKKHLLKIIGILNKELESKQAVIDEVWKELEILQKGIDGCINKLQEEHEHNLVRNKQCQQ